MTNASSGVANAALVTALALLCLGVTACGGGDGKDTTPIPQSLTLGADGDFTGHIVEVTPLVTYAITTNVPMQAGDDTANNLKKGFVRFDLSVLPAGASVVDATLPLTQAAPTATHYADLGGMLRVDHVEVGAALDQSDFSATSLFLNYGTISMDTTLEVKTLGVSTLVARDLADGRTTTDFRFSFASPTDNNGDDDWAEFIAANFVGAPTLQLNLLVPPP